MDGGNSINRRLRSRPASVRCDLLFLAVFEVEVEFEVDFRLELEAAFLLFLFDAVCVPARWFAAMAFPYVD